MKLKAIELKYLKTPHIKSKIYQYTSVQCSRYHYSGLFRNPETHKARDENFTSLRHTEATGQIDRIAHAAELHLPRQTADVSGEHFLAHPHGAMERG